MINFHQWLTRTFGAQAQASRASRRGIPRPPSRRRFVPQVGLLEDRQAPALLIVNSTSDVRNSFDFRFTLYEAIQTITTRTLADTSQAAQVTGRLGDNDTIRFASNLDGAAITLSNFDNDRTVAGPTAFRVSVPMTLDGQTGLTRGVTIERSSSAPSFRLFQVTATGNLTLMGLTLRGGAANGFNGGDSIQSGAGGGSAGLGGAIFNQGTLRILDSTLTGNTARGGAGGGYGTYGGRGGAGGAGLGAAGGSSANTSSGRVGGGPEGGNGGQSVNVRAGSTGGFGGGGGGGFGSNNISFGSGGTGGFGGGGGGAGSGGFNSNGGNGGFGGGGGGAPGGAIGSSHGLAGGGGYGGGGGGYGRLITTQTLVGGGGGGAGMGGAIFNEAGTVVITNSTVTGNTASGGVAGSIYARGTDGRGLGGGLFNRNGTVTVTNSTFSANTAAQGGRGVFNLSDGAGNTGRTTVTNSILGQAGAATVTDFVSANNGGNAPVNAGINNLMSNRGTFPAAGVIAATNPNLGPLQANGGRTQTMALPAGSPAINAGTATGAPGTDQRGAPRDSQPDIGAFEVAGPFVPQQITFAALANRTYGATPFRLTATASSGLPVTFTATGKAELFQLGGVGDRFVRILGAGTATITAHQAGNSLITPAEVAQSFTIAKATLTYTADQASRVFGANNPTLSGRISGFVNGEGTTVTTGTLTFTTSATPSSPAGQYAITGGGLTDTTGNYVFAQFPANTSALTVRAVNAFNLQAAVDAQPTVIVQVTPSTADGVVRAINALTVPLTAKSVTMSLSSGTYGGFTLNPPRNVTVFIRRADGTPTVTIVGRSPALTVAGGDVRAENVTFTTDTHSPTILVAGGKLTLRHNEIWETPGFNDPAIMVTGGSLDMGTSGDPGNNVLHGHGNFLSAVDPRAVSVVGDDFDVDGRVVAGTAPTITTVSSRAATTVIGQGVRLTASVLPWDGGTPTGTVHFFDVATNTDLGRVPLTVVGGVAQAVLTTFRLPVGSHEVRATYEGDGTYIPSEDDLTQVVIADPVSVTSSASGAAAVLTVSGSGGAAPFDIMAFDPSFTGGVNTAVLPLDGGSQIVAAAGPGGGAHVKVFDGATGAVVREFLAFDPAFRGGASVAAGAIGDDAVVVVAAGAGGGPHVKVYDARDGSLRLSFFAFDADFTGGVTVAVGDVNGDGRLDVITGAGPGGGPNVRVFDGVTGQLLRSFFAFDPGFLGGVSVAAGDADGDGLADIAAGAGPGGGPAVAVFDGPSGAPLANFFAYEQETTAGVLVAWTDLDNDGAGVLKTSQAPGGTDPHVFNSLTGQNVDLLFEVLFEYFLLNGRPGVIQAL